MTQHNRFIQLWLIIGIVAGFAAVIFFVITYLNNSILCNLDCRMRNEVNLMLVLLSLFGMFIGSITYYFISEKYEKKITKLHKDAKATYKFLEPEQRSIVNSILKNKGITTQSEIVKDTGLSRVRVSRTLKQLQDKEIIEKSKDGMTNQVRLSKDVLSVFLE